MFCLDGLCRFWKEFRLIAVFPNLQPLGLEGRKIFMMDLYLVFPGGIVENIDFAAHQF